MLFAWRRTVPKIAASNARRKRKTAFACNFWRAAFILLGQSRYFISLTKWSAALTREAILNGTPRFRPILSKRMPAIDLHLVALHRLRRAMTAEQLAADARSVRIEDEVTRRGIRLQGRGTGRAGPRPLADFYSAVDNEPRALVFPEPRDRAFPEGD